MKANIRKFYEQMTLQERARLAFAADDTSTVKMINATVPKAKYSMLSAEYVDTLDYLENACDFWVGNYWRSMAMLNQYRWINSESMLTNCMNDIEPDGSDQNVLLASIDWHQRVLALHKVLERLRDHIDAPEVYRRAMVEPEVVSEEILSKSGHEYLDELEEKLLRVLRVIQ